MLDVRIGHVLAFGNIDRGKYLGEKMKTAPASRCGLWLIILKESRGWKKYFLLLRVLGLPIAMFGKGCASTSHVSSIITLSGIRHYVCMLTLSREQKRLPQLIARSYLLP